MSPDFDSEQACSSECQWLVSSRSVSRWCWHHEVSCLFRALSLFCKPELGSCLQTALSDVALTWVGSMMFAVASPALAAVTRRGPTRAEAEAAKAAGEKRSDQEIAAEQARTHLGVVCSSAQHGLSFLLRQERFNSQG